MGPDQNQQFNNMYANTELYKKNGSTPTYTGNWIKQLCHVVKDHPQIDFVRIHGVTTAKISEFEHIKNMRILSLDTFMDCINNEKEL
jgi:hypothetical protein